MVTDSSRYADEDQPYEFEWPVLREGTTGADGAHYSRAIADFGCMLTIRLSDISPSLQWAIQQRQLYLNAVREGGVIPIHRGSISDTSFGISGEMAGMVIDDTFPGWPGAAQLDQRAEVRRRAVDAFASTAGSSRRR